MIQTNKALFLDRDGVINVDHGYTFQAERIEFINGIFELCRKARSKGYLIIIVTNQSGIARGYYTRKQFKQVTQWIHTEFSKRRIHIEHTYYCPHHPKINLSCCCRKPRSGMLFKAIRQYKINASESIMVGDKLSDVRAAIQAKVGSPILFSPSKSNRMSPPLTQHKKYGIAKTLSAIHSVL